MAGPETASGILGEFGDAAFRLGRYEEASQWYNRGLAIGGVTSPRHQRIRLLFQMARAQYESGHLHVSRRTYLRCREEATQAGDLTIQAHIDHELAMIAEDETKWDEALALLERAEVLMIQVGDSDGLETIRQSIRRILALSQRP